MKTKIKQGYLQIKLNEHKNEINLLKKSVEELENKLNKTTNNLLIKDIKEENKRHLELMYKYIEENLERLFIEYVKNINNEVYKEIVDSIGKQMKIIRHTNKEHILRFIDEVISLGTDISTMRHILTFKNIIPQEELIKTDKLVSRGIIDNNIREKMLGEFYPSVERIKKEKWENE